MPRSERSFPQRPSSSALLTFQDLTLDEWFATAALAGLLSAQEGEPDMVWAAKWALDMGARMGNEARRRRRAGGAR